MRIGLALHEAHDAERRLAADLLRAGERHRTEHGVFHMTRTLAGWAQRNAARLADEAERFDVGFDDDPVDEDEGGLLSRAREKAADLVGRRPEPGVLLLRDLRDLHLAAARASLAWTVLGQGARAISDRRLLEVVTASHPETIRTMKWTVQQLKESSPQVLAS